VAMVLVVVVVVVVAFMIGLLKTRHVAGIATHARPVPTSHPTISRKFSPHFALFRGAYATKSTSHQPLLSPRYDNLVPARQLRHGHTLAAAVTFSPA